MENDIPLPYVGDFPINAFIAPLFHYHNQQNLHFTTLFLSLCMLLQMQQCLNKGTSESFVVVLWVCEIKITIAKAWSFYFNLPSCDDSGRWHYCPKPPSLALRFGKFA
jgi:hypothetical protein